MAKYKVSPIGEFRYPWINKPDTEHNADGVFKVQLILSGKAAESFKTAIQTQADEAFETLLDKKTPAEKKKYKVFVPFVDEEDDEGNPTGRTIFSFKQNHKIKTRDGDLKVIKIEVRDAKENVINVPIYSGSEGRIMFTTRAIEISSAKQAGIRLDFSKVQITKLVKSSGGGFGSVEGGYTADEQDDAQSQSEEDNGGDY